MTKTKNNRIDDVLDTAKGIIRRGETLVPVLFLRLGDRVEVINLQVFPDKDVMSEFMRFIIVSAKPREYLFLCESWLRMFDTKNPDELHESELVAGGEKQVSDLEDKEECILVVHGSKEKGERTGMIKIIRKKNEVEFSNIEWLPKNIEGRMSNLWNPFGGESRIN